jgi:hypothetical protein
MEYDKRIAINLDHNQPASEAFLAAADEFNQQATALMHFIDAERNPELGEESLSKDEKELVLMLQGYFTEITLSRETLELYLTRIFYLVGHMGVDGAAVWDFERLLRNYKAAALKFRQTNRFSGSAVGKE